MNKPAFLLSYWQVKSETEYHCQHGPRECLRNILQACVLSGVPEQDDQLRFVDCAMKSPALVDYEQVCTMYNHLFDETIPNNRVEFAIP